MKSNYFSFLLAFSMLVSPAESFAETKLKSAKSPQKTASKPAQSAPALDIAAVAGERAISSFDVDSRIKFIVATTKITDSPEVLKNIRPQVIRTLIDESLQIQEAEKNDITIPDTEVRQAIMTIEAQRGMPAGGIANMLRSGNVPEKTFVDQIRAQLAWNKLIGKNIRPRIKISDEEIALARGRLASPVATDKELEIAVIALPVDKPQQLAAVKKTSEKLLAELQKGAQFSEVARQFSATSDGKSFWVRPQQLDPIIADGIKTLAAGAISQPIRTANGFSIVKLLNIRAAKNDAETPDADVKLKEILLKLKNTSDENEADILLQISEAIAKTPDSCDNSSIASIKDLDAFNIEVNFLKTSLSSLPSAIRTIAEGLPVGGMSNPFASEEGVRLYMLCEKKPINGLSDDKIREVLFRQKFELEAQKYLRNLKLAAFIEVRE